MKTITKLEAVCFMKSPTRVNWPVLHILFIDRFMHDFLYVARPFQNGMAFCGVSWLRRRDQISICTTGTEPGPVPLSMRYRIITFPKLSITRELPDIEILMVSLFGSLRALRSIG